MSGKSAQTLNLVENAIRRWLNQFEAEQLGLPGYRQTYQCRTPAHSRARAQKLSITRRCGYLKKKPRPSLRVSCGELLADQLVATEGSTREPDVPDF